MAERLRCVWPIIDPEAPIAKLHQDAIADLPEVASRARFRIWRILSFQIALGQCVPGSGGARLVVVVECVGETVDNVAAARRAWEKAVAS